MSASRYVLLLILFQLIVGPASADTRAVQIERALQCALDEAAPAGARQPGVLASVSAPSLGLEWSGASGRFDRDKTAPLQPNQTYRIASITKVFTAAAVFRLIESGQLGLYDPIDWHLSRETAGLLRSGHYDPASILIQHLLAHTSGIQEYAMDPTYLESAVNPKSKHKRWTRAEQIELAMRRGAPIAKPGAQYSYSDTGYVILGEIIERASGQPMAKYIRNSLGFSSLGLHSTYFEIFESPPQGAAPRAHQYLGDTDVTDNDASFDLYGGGGLVSTTADLNRFFRALLNGKVFERTRTLASALTTVNAERTDEDYLQSYLIASEEFGQRTCLGHGGFWGSTSIYCPDIDVAISFTVNETTDSPSGGSRERRAKLIAGIAAALDVGRDAKPAQP